MKPKQFVAIQECSAGNESIGNEWLSTATFPSTATLEQVHAWADKVSGRGGKLIIRHDESQTDDDDIAF